MAGFKKRSMIYVTKTENLYFEKTLDLFKDFSPEECALNQEEKDFLRKESKFVKNETYFFEPPEMTKVALSFLKKQQINTVLSFLKLGNEEKENFRKSINSFKIELSHDLMKQGKYLFTIGTYQKVELIILKYAVYKFLIENDISLVELTDQVRSLLSNPTISKICQYGCTFLSTRRYHNVYRTLFYYFHPHRNTPLSEEHKLQIAALQRLSKLSIAQISYEVGQTPYHVTSYFNNLEERARQSKISIVSKKVKPDDLEESLIITEYEETRNYHAVARKFNVKRSFIRDHIVTKYTNAMISNWTEKCDFIVAVLVLRDNFFCPFFEVDKILPLMDFLISNYSITGDIANNETTESNHEGQISALKEKNDKNTLETKEKMPKKPAVISSKSLNESLREKSLQDTKFFSKEEKETFSRNTFQSDENDEKENIVENYETSNSKPTESNEDQGKLIIKQMLEENFKVRHTLNTFLKCEIDFEAKIEDDGIFWDTIKRKTAQLIPNIMKTDLNCMKSKFKILCKSKNIVKYTDLIKYISNYSFEYVIQNVEEKLNCKKKELSDSSCE